MAGFVFRRILLMIPTFLGITLLTFGVMSIGGDDLERARLQDGTLGGRTRRIHEAMGYDLPALVNLDVQDARRWVEFRAERIATTWHDARRELAVLAEAVALAQGDSPTVAGAWAEHVVEQNRIGLLSGAVARAGPGELPRVADDARGRALRAGAGRVVIPLLELADDLDRLARCGAQTVLYLAPIIGDVDSAGMSLLLATAERALSRTEPAVGFADVDALRHHVDGHRAAWTDQAAIASLVDAWVTRARAARTSGELADVERPLAVLGGLMVPHLLPRLLDEDRFVRAAASSLLREHAARDLGYHAYGRRGRPLDADGARRQAVEDVRLERWWRRSELQFREVSGVARYGWHSWTRTRYARWLKSVATLDFGTSLRWNRPVSELLADRLPITLLVQGLAIFFMYVLAIPVSLWTASRRGQLSDRAVTVVVAGLIAAPRFWVATMCLLWLGSVFPLGGLHTPDIDSALTSGELSRWSWRALTDLAWHLVLPVFVLTYAGAAVLSRYGRSGMIEALRQDWVRTARAKGLEERTVLRRHVLRNGILPLVTLFGTVLPTLVGGSVVVERIFSIPGMGLLAWDGVMQQDVPVVMAIVALTGIATMVGYVLTDVIYALVDPRIRAG